MDIERPTARQLQHPDHRPEDDKYGRLPPRKRRTGRYEHRDPGLYQVKFLDLTGLTPKEVDKVVREQMRKGKG